MKKYLIATIALIILFILIIKTPYSNATNNIHLDITSQEFLSDFDPNKPTSNEIKILYGPMVNTIINVSNIIIGIIQVIGGILCVISITIFGFGMVVSINGPLSQDVGLGGLKRKGDSPNARMELLSLGRSLLIGSVLLFSSVTLVKFLLNVLIST